MVVGLLLEFKRKTTASGTYPSTTVEAATRVPIMDRDGRAVRPLLPEVNIFQLAHPCQGAQVQTLQPVPSHGQLVHGAQSLQHGRDVGETVE